MRRRDLYKFAAEAMITNTKNLPSVEKMIKDVCNYQVKDGLDPEIKPGDIDIIKRKLNYCEGEMNPVNSVKFFCKEYPNGPFNIDKDQVSLLLPSKFQECFIRVYAHESSKLPAIKKAFKRYCNKVLNL